ncbi:protein terminal ear1 [Ziziphus jujuba]|uniref:Protein terminal ear1 n=1 Tax=Ziziphus jujuba TaxID=326968 RepID=A0A6P4AG39_ZIZJJ|nr:protein terminal ear1 [Ziziphus jujuba]
MDETGIVRFPGSLDPRAEEFRPRNPSGSNQLTLYTTTPPPAPPPPPPPQVYYPYGSPYPPISEVQVLPFCDGGGVGGYPGFSSPTAYVSLSPAAVASVRPAVPPPPASAVATRALLLSSVPRELSETMIRKELECFGEVRGVQMEKVCDGMATVHFYDLRHAEIALREIRDQHMQQQTRLRNHYAALFMHNSPSDDHNFTAVSLPMPPPARGLIAGCAVWAQFVIPASNAVPDGHNQGTIVIFNLDSEVTASSLKDIFQAFGPVKELRETPSKKHQKFVEFYDVRDAAKALKEMNGKEIHGKPIVIEFSRPGGHSRKFMNAMAAHNNNNLSISAAAATISSINSINNFYPRIQKYHPAAPPPYLPRKFSGRSALTGVDHTPPPSFASSQPQFFSKKSNFGKGIVNGNVNKNTTSSNNVASSLGGVEYKMNALNLGGGGAVCDGIEDKGDSNGHNNNNNNPKRLTKRSHSNQPTTVTVLKQQQQQQQHQQPRTRPRKGRQAKKFDSRFLINEDALTESNCRDSRTTVMIKNIPNKYSQKLLLNMLDNHCIHCNEQIADEGHDQPLSCYDFVYLPIDFNNKCNVGYGFVNMTTPQATWRLYKAFHHQHWEVFNSRKICEVTYARVQGLEALKEHFKNSKFPCEMDHYLPVVFSPPRDGRQQTEPLPIVGHQNKHHLVIPIGADDDQHHDGDGGEMDGHDSVEEDGDDDDEEEEDDDGHDVGDESEESSESEQGQLLLLMGDSGTGCSSSSLNGGVGVDCCCDLEEDS